MPSVENSTSSPIIPIHSHVSSPVDELVFDYEMKAFEMFVLIEGHHANLSICDQIEKIDDVNFQAELCEDEEGYFFYDAESDIENDQTSDKSFNTMADLNGLDCITLNKQGLDEDDIFVMDDL